MFTQEEIIKAYGPFIVGNIEDPMYIQMSIYEVENFPRTLRAFFEKLSPDHQNACYREGGWTFRQVIHHLADSHLQAFTRFKLALTEENPTIKPYIQNAWASTNDSVLVDAIHSVNLLESVHIRWVKLMQTMSMDEFKKTFFHPDSKKLFTLGEALGLYAWHGRHHYTQMYRHSLNKQWI